MIASRICRDVVLSAAIFVLRLPGQAPLTPSTIREMERVSPGLENEYLRALRTDGALVTKTHPTGKHASGYEAWKLVIPAEYKIVVGSEAVEMISSFYLPRNVGDTFAKSNSEGRLTGYSLVGD